jgi:putative flippase GtrA
VFFNASYAENRLYWTMLEISFGFVPTNAFTYALNKKCVFVSGRHHPTKEFILFTLAAFLSLVVAQICVYSLVIHSQIDDFLIKLAVITVCTLFNFLFRKFFVFVS